MAKESVLVIDDEKDLIELLRYNLEKEGFRVEGMPDGETGLAATARLRPDLVLVDLMLPGMDGLEVCRRLRADAGTASIPIIMLTAKSAEADRVVGLELGADDYVAKPFSPRELAARIRAVLRRAGTRGVEPEGEIVRRGDLVIDPGRREARRGGKPLALTATEFRLLHLLSLHPGRVFSRAELINAVLGREVAVVDRTIDVHITGLRRKMAGCGDLIETVRGFGYRFREPGT